MIHSDERQQCDARHAAQQAAAAAAATSVSPRLSLAAPIPLLSAHTRITDARLTVRLSSKAHWTIDNTQRNDEQAREKREKKPQRLTCIKPSQFAVFAENKRQQNKCLMFFIRHWKLKIHFKLCDRCVMVVELIFKEILKLTVAQALAAASFLLPLMHNPLELSSVRHRVPRRVRQTVIRVAASASVCCFPVRLESQQRRTGDCSRSVCHHSSPCYHTPHTTRESERKPKETRTLLPPLQQLSPSLVHQSPLLLRFPLHRPLHSLTTTTGMATPRVASAARPTCRRRCCRLARAAAVWRACMPHASSDGSSVAHPTL